MKYILTTFLIAQTGLAFADYSCQEKDSRLLIASLSETKVKVTYLPKKVTRLPMDQVFEGQKVSTPSSDYYKVEEFELKSDAMTGYLKISTIPVLGRIPACRGRACHDISEAKVNYEIYAELQKLGASIQYTCEKY